MPEGSTAKIVRRRRSWYRRRLRVQRTLVAFSVMVVLAGACWQNVARYFSLPTIHASQFLPESFWTRQTIHRDPDGAIVLPVKRAKSVQRIPGIYPYSVVPGGVRNLSELRSAAAHDAVVRRHYSHFDFDHAKLFRLPETREVFLSYRIRDTVFWTRKRVRLQPGELLLTDGTTTARARCGNQISDTAKPEVSDEEPAEDVLDQPVVAVSSGPFLPVRPVLGAPELPAGQPNPPALFAGGFVFPFVPVGVPLPRICRADEIIKDGRCVPHRKPVVPEPSTMLLLSSGLGIILWCYRKSLDTVTV